LLRDGFFFVLATISTAFISFYFGSVQKVQDPAENTMRFLTVQDIRESTVIADSKLEKNYVHRPAVEKELNEYIEGKPTKKYLIVYGPKGAGKSSVVLKTLSEKKGVALVEVPNGADKAQLSKMVAQAVMNTKQEVSTDSDEVYKTLRKIKDDIANDKNADKGNYPTIVFEVERGGTDEDIRLIENVRSLSKKFSTVANVIIILSEAIAVTTFGRDPKREKYMYVGDMTREEAKQLLEKLGKHLNDTDFTHLYDNIGGRPIDLTDFASRDVSVKDFVGEELEKAVVELAKFPHRHRQLLSLLKQHPEGVHITVYHVEDMLQFGKEMKRRNVVYFDIDQKVFKLQSRALELALKDYPLK
jgi:GTPase SAR1 family protein